MRRKLFTLTAAVSAVLCAGVCGLWVRSYFASDILYRQGWEDEGDRSYRREDIILTGRGGVGMNRFVDSGPRATYRAAVRRMTAESPPVQFHRVEPALHPGLRFVARISRHAHPAWGGFEWGAYADMEAGRARPQGYAWQVVVPYWSLVGVLAAMPAVWFHRRFRLWGRINPNSCGRCGYDLRATPGRCPEMFSRL